MLLFAAEDKSEHAQGAQLTYSWERRRDAGGQRRDLICLHYYKSVTTRWMSAKRNAAFPVKPLLPSEFTCLSPRDAECLDQLCMTHVMITQHFSLLNELTLLLFWFNTRHRRAMRRKSVYKILTLIDLLRSSFYRMHSQWSHKRHFP